MSKTEITLGKDMDQHGAWLCTGIQRRGLLAAAVPPPPRLIIRDPLLSSSWWFIPMPSKKTGACGGTEDFNMFIIHFYAMQV